MSEATALPTVPQALLLPRGLFLLLRCESMRLLENNLNKQKEAVIGPLMEHF